MHCHFLSKLKEIFRIPPTGDFYSLHSTWFAVLDIENNSLDDESLPSLAQHVSLYCQVVPCNKKCYSQLQEKLCKRSPDNCSTIGQILTTSQPCVSSILIYGWQVQSEDYLGFPSDSKWKTLKTLGWKVILWKKDYNLGYHMNSRSKPLLNKY